MRADHAKTKDYCMTRFFGHGQSILQVFETSIALSMVKSVKSPFFQTLLVPISWTLAICALFIFPNKYNIIIYTVKLSYRGMPGVFARFLFSGIERKMFVSDGAQLVLKCLLRITEFVNWNTVTPVF